MDCSPPGSSLHGILQSRISEWVATSYSKGSYWPRDRTCTSCISCTGRQILYHWATWLTEMKPYVHTDLHTNVHSSFTFMSPKLKQSKCPSTSEWIHNGGIPDNYPAINSNELLLWRVTPQRGWLKKSLSWLKENSRKWNITVTESRSVVSWGRRGDWRGDYKGALVNFQGWWIYSLSWLWSWCYRCKHISKLIKRYFKYMQVSWTVCALSHIQHFAPPQTVAHQASLSMGFSWQEYWSAFIHLKCAIMTSFKNKDTLLNSLCNFHMYIDINIQINKLA